MEIFDDQPQESEPSAELDGGRIRQLTALRRGAIRSRSWCLIALVVCVVGAIQLLLNTVSLVRREGAWGLRATGYILFVSAGFMGAVFFFRRAKELKREIEKPVIDEPDAPPDFSTLGDGSQRWKNLENIEISPPAPDGRIGE